MAADLKLSDKLFLGKEELNHLKKTLREGYKTYFKHDVGSYGVGYTLQDVNRDSFKVIPGTAPGKISIQQGYAIDGNIDIIQNSSLAVDEFTLLPDGVSRFITLSYIDHVLEEGLVSVDASGVVSGIGTVFTEALRGMPNFSSKISFENSIGNNSEYRVASVISDTSVQLNVSTNSMNVESGLRYRVVGTFNRSYVPSAIEKYPFIKNGRDLQLENSDTSDGIFKFILAIVSYDGATLTISDQRSKNVLSTGSGNEDSHPSQTNPLIGLEKITYGGVKSDLQKNLVKIGWGFTSLNGQWTLDSVNQEIIIADGAGGAWNSTSNFTNGDWDGWKVWLDDSGAVISIISSIKVGLNIKLSVEIVDPLLSTGSVVVIPDAHEVEISFSNGSNPTGATYKSFPIHQGGAQIEVEAGITHEVTWRHIKGINSTNSVLINNGSYYPESQFNSMGVLSGIATTSTITAGMVPVTLNPLNHEDNKGSRTLQNIWSGFNIFLNKVSILGPLLVGVNRVTIASSGVMNNSTIFNGKNKVNVKATTSSQFGLSFSGFDNSVQGSRVIVIENDRVGSVSNIHLLHEDTGSSLGSRMRLPYNRDIILRPGEMAKLIYDETGNPDSRWILVSTTSTPRTTAGSISILSGAISFTFTPPGTVVTNKSYQYRKNSNEVTLDLLVDIVINSAVAQLPEMLWFISSQIQTEIELISNFGSAGLMPGLGITENFNNSGGSSGVGVNGASYMSGNVMIIRPESGYGAINGDTIRYKGRVTFPIV